MRTAYVNVPPGVVYAPPLPRDRVAFVTSEQDETIRRAQSGDEAAFRELFLKHRQDVTRVVYRSLGPSADLEDVVQDVFVHVYRSLLSFRGESKFSTWLYRLATNVARMHLRKARSRPRFAHVEVPDRPVDSDSQPAGEEAVDRDGRVRALYEVLGTLTDKKREVLVLHDLEGKTASEIAELVGAPVLTVRTRLFYARKELYAALSQNDRLKGVLEELERNESGMSSPPSATRDEERP